MNNTDKTICRSETTFRATALLNEEVLAELQVPDPDEDTTRNDRGASIKHDRQDSGESRE